MLRRLLIALVCLLSFAPAGASAGAAWIPQGARDALDGRGEEIAKQLHWKYVDRIKARGDGRKACAMLVFLTVDTPKFIGGFELEACVSPTGRASIPYVVTTAADSSEGSPVIGRTIVEHPRAHRVKKSIP